MGIAGNPKFYLCLMEDRLSPDPDAPARFPRVMILPPDLAGKSSITYVYEEDQGKPKSRTYKGYCEETLVLG